MNKELLIFGADGALGSGVTKVLSSKNYDNIHLFDFIFNDKTEDDKINKHIIKDLSLEENGDLVILCGPDLLDGYHETNWLPTPKGKISLLPQDSTVQDKTSAKAIGLCRKLELLNKLEN